MKQCMACQYFQMKSNITIAALQCTAVQYEEILTQFQNSLSQTAPNNTILAQIKMTTASWHRGLQRIWKQHLVLLIYFFKILLTVVSFHRLCSLWYLGARTIVLWSDYGWKMWSLTTCGHPPSFLPPLTTTKLCPGILHFHFSSCIAQCAVCSVRCPCIQNAPGYLI